MESSQMHCLQVIKPFDPQATEAVIEDRVLTIKSTYIDGTDSGFLEILPQIILFFKEISTLDVPSLQRLADLDKVVLNGNIELPVDDLVRMGEIKLTQSQS